jgi:hypothetical protein
MKKYYFKLVYKIGTIPDNTTYSMQQYSKKYSLMPLKQRCVDTFITFFFILLFWGCSSIQERDWTALIPAESSFLIVPNPEVNLNNIGTVEYTSILDDLTPSAIQQLGNLPDSITQYIDLKGMVLFPSSSTKSQLIWLTKTNQTLNDFAQNFYEPFEQNYYSFNYQTIHKIHLNDYLIFAAQVHDWLIFSESSLAIESALRSYMGLADRLSLPYHPVPGQLIVNAPKLDKWVQQFISVGLRPNIMGSTTGLTPSSLRFEPLADDNPGFELNGLIQTNDTLSSTLVTSISLENSNIKLDRYIAGNSAAFAIFRHPAPSIPLHEPSMITPLDSLLLDDITLFQDLSLTIDNELAIVTFPESGLLTDGEFLFLRNLQNGNALRSAMEDLAKRGFLLKNGNSFYVKSSVLGKLIGSEMAPFTDFYVSFSQNVAVISKRRGLSESVEADRTRRRTIYYDETFKSVKSSLIGGVSGFVWAKSSEFLKFMEPMLTNTSSLDGLIGAYDILTMTFQKNSNESITFNFKSLIEEGSSQPYDELWVLPLQTEELTGTPTLGNIVGSSSDEIIIATSAGRIEALAFDGTSVMQAFTNNGDIPIGSPILYDWYGNGKPVILQAAGTKIYAWNEGGRLLPQFPIEIGEQISAPIVISDVTRNGIPEIIVATENRKIHVVDGRGQNLRGWPQFTSAIVRQSPVHAEVDDEYSIWVVSQNILHSWQRNGAVRPGYPTFVNASFNAEPLVFEDQIIGAGSDGYVYSIGQDPDFLETLSISIQMDSIRIKSLYATSSQLNKISVEERVLLRDSTGFYRSDLYVTQSTNGSILMFNPDGKLELTNNLGQPTSTTYTPEIKDLNGDNRAELIALAEFGRLFAWEVLTGRRVFNIPTSGMKYPIIEDINGDGSYELIAQTREGLRCWTINKPEN